MITEEELMERYQRAMKNPKLVERNQALRAYAEMFGTFPTYGFPGNTDEMIICARDCVEQGKNVYEMGYMVNPKDLGDIVY